MQIKYLFKNFGLKISSIESILCISNISAHFYLRSLCPAYLFVYLGLYGSQSMTYAVAFDKICVWLSVIPRFDL